MSRNTDKIGKALSEKGYTANKIEWTPIRRGCEMCGPEGGWYIDYEEADGYAIDGMPQKDIIVEYAIDEVMEAIAKLPTLEPIFLNT